MAAMNTWVLPEPDSPTMPTHSRGATASDTSRTAAIVSPSERETPRCKFSMLSVGSTSALLHVEGVAQAVAEDVQAQQQQGEKTAGHEQYPRRRFHFPGALRDQRPEARVRLLDAEAQKAQETLEQNDLRYGRAWRRRSPGR